MKEKCTLILLVIILLLIILIKLSFMVPSILEIHNISKLSSDDENNNNSNNNNLKVQNNFKTSALSNNNCTTTTTKTKTKTTTKAINHIIKNNRLLKNSIKICSHSLDDNFIKINNNNLNINLNNYNNNNNKLYRKINFNSKSNYHPNPKKLLENIPICYSVVTFMITITLVKFVVVVLAYQQLLQNGYIIIQNLYDKHLRSLNFDLLICSQQRPYQQLLKSGHGLDVEENHQNPSEKRQFVNFLNSFIEFMKIIKSRKRKYQRQRQRQTSSIFDDAILTEQKYTSIIEKTDSNMLKMEASSNDPLLYHQNTFFESHHNFYQQPCSYGYHRFHSKYHEFLFIRNLFDDGKLFYQLFGKATKAMNPINHNIFYSKAAKSILFEKSSYFEINNKLLTSPSSHHIFLRQNALAHPAAYSILVSAASSTTSTLNSNSIYNSVTKLKKKIKPKIKGFVLMQNMLRSYADRIESLPSYYHSAIILPSLTSLSSTICCWKTSTTGNRKRRKRKFSFIWDWDNKNEYIRNCGRSFTLFTNNNCCYCYCCCCSCCCCYCYCCCCYCCCCCCCSCLKNQMGDVFYENTAEAEIFLVKCCKTCNYCSCFGRCHCCNNCINYHYHCHYCIYQINNNYSNECSIQNNSSCVQLNIFKTNNHNKTTTIRLSKNIYNLANETSNHQDGRKWCLQTSSHSHHATANDSSGGNLLRTLNAVKDIASSFVQNRTNNNKRKLKKNLVWLFIGLVWLEGPKLINCSINHNNNDVTSLNGSETTNKIDSSNNAGGQNQNRNGDNSGNSNSSGSRSSSSRNNNEGSTNNTNGPGTNTTETHGKGQKGKSSSSYKIPETESSNGGSGGGGNNEHLNEFLLIKKEQFPSSSLKMISSIERPTIRIEKQFQYQTFGHHQQPSNIDSKTNLSPKRSNRDSSQPSLYVSEEANRAQSDFSRLESIKRQILTKLGLTEKPNVTHPLPKQFIWDTIYRADGIRSVSDFDFNDNNHRLQEHIMRSKPTGVLESPPLLSRQNSMSNSNLNQKKQQLISRNSIANEMRESRTPRSHNIINNDDIKTVKDIGSIGSRWKLLNLTSEQAEKIHQKYLRKYRQQQQQQRLRNRNIISRNKNRFSDPDYLEGDEFFGSTQEIITFAEKGKVYKKHRLVEFSPPSNKIPKQKLQIRNAEIHIRIEKVSPIAEKTLIGQFKSRNHHKNKLNSSREPSLKIWIFQLIGSDFSRKGFDQVARLCTSLSVDHNVLGWQKLDITETVQFWYGKQQNDKLRLLIDCTGCGNRYILHLFDKKFHNSVFMPTTPLKTAKTPTKLRPSLNDTVEQQNYTIYKNYSSLNTERDHVYHSADNFNSNKNNESLRNLYHHRQYIHHRYRRKNRTIQKLKLNSDSEDSIDDALDKLQLNQLQGQTKDVNHPQSLWLKSRTYRTNREIINPHNISQDQNQSKNRYHGNDQEHLEEGISYEVAASEFHLEDRLNPNRPFLVLHTEPSRARRVRRRAVDCSGAIQGQCCKESFYVSFKALGWDDWIIAPRGYFANYCRGDCTGPFRTPDTFQTFHAHFIEEYRKMGLLNGMQPCCAPVKFSSMSLIYYGDDGIIKRDLPKMVVDECGCP